MDETIITSAETSFDLEKMNQLTQFLMGLPVIGEWIPVLFALIFTASIVVATTKTPKKGTWLHTVYKWGLELPALNIFRAKDKG